MALIATTRQAGVLRVSAIFLLALAALLFCPTRRSAQALTFDLSYDSSVPGAPAGFLPAFNDALQFYETTFTDPITINLQVGWGTINNQSLSPGAVGESFVNGQVFSHFAGVKSALSSDAKSAADETSVANMPANDPTGNAIYAMSDAEGKRSDCWPHMRRPWMGTLALTAYLPLHLIRRIARWPAKTISSALQSTRFPK